MSDMNIEYTGRLYDAAKVRRFAGKVYDRVARSSRIMLSVFIVVGLAVEVMAYLRGGHLDLYLLFLLALIVFALKFNRARFQKSMDLVIRRFMGDSDEGTVAMTDTCYEFRSGDNVMRVVWRSHACCLAEPGLILRLSRRRACSAGKKSADTSSAIPRLARRK